MLRILSSAVLALGVSVPAPASAGDMASRRAEFSRALSLAERGPLSEARQAARPLADHPLAAYLDYALLRRQLATVAPQQVRSFLDQHAGTPLAGPLRAAWLETLAGRGDWASWRAFDDGAPLSARTPLQRCAALRARLDQRLDTALLDDIEATWLSGSSLPDRCDPAFAALKAAGRITPELVWKRAALAVEAGEHGLLRYLATLLPADQAERARDYAGFLQRPDRAARAWPAQPLARAVAVAGLRRLAQHDPARAAVLLDELAPALALEPAARGAVLHAVALWSAASYLPDAASRFAAVPAASWDAQLHEWQVREAIARGAHGDALAAIDAMPGEQRQDPRWRYLEARLREQAGDADAARALLAPLAEQATWHGFLAADRLDQPYALCPREAEADPALQARVRQHPALARALELFALDRTTWAVHEWHAALDDFDDAARRFAVSLAVEAGWYDRAVFALEGGEELAFYELRFPLDHASHLAQAARGRNLDPAWVAALIRAESVWMADARSHANARGLMQLVPATGKALARKLGLRWRGAATLYEPRANITLGTAYLRAMLDRFGGEPAVATAAYNAGPTPATRWQQQRPRDPVDLWIETIPYRETREYVARVFAFSVIYDWRLHGSAVPLSARLAGTPVSDAGRRAFHCPQARVAATSSLAGSP